MAAISQEKSCSLSNLAINVIVIALIIIAISSVAHTTLALKENSQGKSGVVRQQCLTGLENAAVEKGLCTSAELQTFNNAILPLRESQGIKAAKDACMTQITSQGCKGICIAAVNCYDLQ